MAAKTSAKRKDKQREKAKKALISARLKPAAVGVRITMSSAKSNEDVRKEEWSLALSVKELFIEINFFYGFKVGPKKFCEIK